MDDNAFNFSSVAHLSGVHWYIFREFFDSGLPLALDGQRHASATSACLKIIFMHGQAPHSWHPLRVYRSQRHHTDLKPKTLWHRHVGRSHLRTYRHRRADLKPKTLWHRSVRHSYLRTYRHRADLKHRGDLKPKTLWHQGTRFIRYFWTYLFSQVFQKFPQAFWAFEREIEAQHIRSVHLKFLLEKAAYSDSVLNFARRRVFRFGYLQQSHPTYMKKAIFALAKYIHRVTGETAEVRACESIWGRHRWFAAQ
jgi:hypothetical protein